MATIFKNVLIQGVGTPLTVTTVTPSSPSAGSVTLTFATQSTAPYTSGQKITISGISVSGYNGTYTVTACTASTVTYANSTTGAATGGTITQCAMVSNASATTTVIGLSLSNTSGNIVQASVQIQDTIAGTQAYFINNVTIPANTSARIINGGERLVLGASSNVLVNSNTASSIDLVMSWVEIS